MKDLHILFDCLNWLAGYIIKGRGFSQEIVPVKYNWAQQLVARQACLRPAYSFLIQFFGAGHLDKAKLPIRFDSEEIF